MSLQGLIGTVSESPRNVNYKGYIIDASDISVTNYISQYIMPKGLPINVTDYKYIGDITEDYYEITSGNSNTTNDKLITSGDSEQDNNMLIK